MSLIVKIICRDQIGIVSRMATGLSALGYNIIDSSQFYEPEPGKDRETGEGRFFMRIECVETMPNGRPGLDAFLATFARDFGAETSVADKARPMPTVVMVSRFDHCLQDIFYRVRTGELPIEITAVVANHPDSREDAERRGVPFHLLEVTPETKAEQEAKLQAIVEETGSELIVLARYMQILSDGFCAKHPGRIINIHHSFLPAFKGAKPYHRAWDRGVKHIGATAHYVTADLDEGPIIEQDTIRVTHTASPSDLVTRGREVEARVLSRAVQLHAENRVFINGSRTVVFYP